MHNAAFFTRDLSELCRRALSATNPKAATGALAGLGASRDLSANPSLGSRSSREDRVTGLNP